MIYTVTLNPSVDYIIGVEDFEQGRVNRSIFEKFLPGGKGINVSIVLNNLGYDTCALGFVGGFTGDFIRNSLKSCGVKSDFVLLKNGTSRINAKIKESDETEINGMGPEITGEEKNLLTEKLKGLKEGDTLVLAGSVPKGLGKKFYSEILKKINTDRIKAVVDAEGELLTNTLKHRPFLIKPNNFELEQIFGVEIKSKNETFKYAKELQKMGARNVIVSMGGEGGIIVCENGEAFYSPAPKGKVINTTGSGDSVVAGFIAGFEEYSDFRKAFVMGISSGSASAFSENLAEKNGILSIYNDLIEKTEKIN